MASMCVFMQEHTGLILVNQNQAIVFMANISNLFHVTPVRKLLASGATKLRLLLIVRDAMVNPNHDACMFFAMEKKPMKIWAT